MLYTMQKILAYLAGHSTHSKVEGRSCKTSMQNKGVFYFHFNIFIFENIVAGKKCN